MQQSGSIAAAVVTAGVHPHQTQDSSDIDCRKQWNLNLSVKTSQAIELQQSHPQIFSDGEKIDQVYFREYNSKDDNDSLNSYWHKEHRISSSENQMRKENSYQEKSQGCHGKSNNDDFRLNIKDRKFVLKEKNSASPDSTDEK